VNFSDVPDHVAVGSKALFVKRATVDWAFVSFEPSFDMYCQIVLTCKDLGTRRLATLSDAVMHTGEAFGPGRNRQVRRQCRVNTPDMPVPAAFGNEALFVKRATVDWTLVRFKKSFEIYCQMVFTCEELLWHQFRVRFSDVFVTGIGVSEPNCVKRANRYWTRVLFDHSYVSPHCPLH